MARSKRGLRKRIVVLSLVLFALAGSAVFFFWIYRRGLERQDLAEQAKVAYQKEDYEEAARLAKEVLASYPNNRGIRVLLTEALHLSGRTDEAKALAQGYWDEGPGNVWAAIFLCNLALGESDLRTAEEIARKLADAEPSYAYRTIALIQDAQGIALERVSLRLGSIATMRALAAQTDDETVRAMALIFAGELSLELADHLPQGHLLKRQAREDLKRAVTTVRKARQINPGFETNLAMGRIHVLSLDETESALGARELREFVEGVLKQDIALAALAKYHLRREEWVEAMDAVRRIKDLYMWNRVFWGLRRSTNTDLALEALEASPMTNERQIKLLRGEILVRSEDEARKTEGGKLLKELIHDPEASTGLLVGALRRSLVYLGREKAQELIKDAPLEKRTETPVRAVLAAIEGDEEAAREIALEDTTGADAFLLLRLGDQKMLDVFVESLIRKGGETGFRYRLERVISLLAQVRKETDQTKAEKLRGRALTDVKALAADKAAPKDALPLVMTVAAAMGELELAGEFLARAIPMPGDPELIDAIALQQARSLKPELAKRFADGVRRVAENSEARDYLRVFANVLEQAPTIGAPSSAADELEKVQGAARPLALELAARITVVGGDPERGEQLARRALEENPDSATALQLTGALLLRRQAYDDVVSLFSGVEKVPHLCYDPLIRAQVLLGRKDEALATAREMHGRFPRSVLANKLLAEVYVARGEDRNALRTLSIAPPRPILLHMRAELLYRIAEYDMAEQHYRILLSRSALADVDAWHGLRRVLTKQGRNGDFITAATKVLEKKQFAKRNKLQGTLHFLKGMCLELDGKIEEAIADYEKAVEFDSTSWRALNNAAWHIATLDPSRIADARAYIDRALKLGVKDATIFDTAAEVYALQGEFKKALGYIDEAIRGSFGNRSGLYKVHRARIVQRMDGYDEDELLAYLNKIRAEYEGQSASHKARDMINEIDQTREKAARKKREDAEKAAGGDAGGK